MTAMPSKEVTTARVAGVAFGFYSDEEVRTLSVKKIDNPILYDNLKSAIPNGLYDAAMGPTEQHGSCATCGLRYQYCPGHFGHIELAVPVYNPLFFTTMYKLLRATCLHCFRLKLGEEEVEKYRQRLLLLQEGRLVEAASMTVGASSAAVKRAQQLSQPDGDAALPGKKGGRSWGIQPAPGTGLIRDGRTTVHTVEAVRNTISELLKRMPTTKCANCNAHNPNIRREGASKIFQLPLSVKQITANQVQRTPILSALSGAASRGGGAEEVEAQMAAELAAQAQQRKRKQPEDAGSDEEEDEKIDDLKPADEKKHKAEPAATAPASAVASGKAAAAVGPEARPRYMTPAEVEEVMRRMWARNQDILALIFSADQRPAVHQSTVRGAQGYRLFFLHTVPVAPNKFRPPSRLGDLVFEHPQNTVLAQVINANLDLGSMQSEVAPGESLDLGRALRFWLDLQSSVNALMDSSTSDKGGVGIKQQLEKKEGLFRKNMMGKRVNFACRSVISPDPYIGTGEIGVPPYFAKKLSMPERVTPFNVEMLRQAVRNGADVLPGAVAVEDELGRIVSLAAMAPQRRDALAKTLLAKSSAGGGGGGGTGRASMRLGAGKIVYRHLRDGDLMLTNRQPTLHKPGLMAHTARVLKGERTIRMHYANCATFNADFDGDEINLHLPQDQLGRAEGYAIVHADQQYIVPTDGKPIRGLIQDHVDAGVLLTARDAFLTRPQYMQLLCNACASSRAAVGAALPELRPEPPAILKPRPLWTGKQVVSAVLAHWTRGMPPVTMRAKGKLPADYWGANSGEDVVEFCGGQLMTGCLDKAQFGKFGLVHAVQELYGNTVAGRLLSSFSRLFTFYLQTHGFTCGLDDVVLLQSAERDRATHIHAAESQALQASAGLAGLTGLPQEALLQRRQQVQRALGRRYRADAATGALHDMAVTSVLNPLASAVVKACLPGGQQKRFPENCMSMMTATGAKGSQVNFSQISCLLGQQELEGRRVPRMASGKTLPCFAAFDGGARSAGFVGDRFLSGLRPQEYYFHCMAGREGLVDTTVKTSRSGYLQRCMVKNLESLRTHYDATVRDDTDGSIIQFYYGEDAVDVLQTSYLREFGFLAENADRFAQQLDLHHAARASAAAGLLPEEAAVAKAARVRQKQLAKAAKGKVSAAEVGAALPLMAQHWPSCLGVTSEAFGDALRQYLHANPDKLLKPDGSSGRRAGRRQSQEAAERGQLDPRSAEGFQRLMELKYLRALAAPGEAVGVLAAQSIGEPSTQMTLNTFHMAGRGEANVTLGIPRLRELFMTAAQSIKTPVMVLPLVPGLPHPQDAAAALANRLRRLRLAEVLAGMSVEELITAPVGGAGVLCQVYRTRLRLHPAELYPPAAELTFQEVADAFTASFVPRLRAAVKAELRKGRAAGAIGVVEAGRLGGEEGAAAARAPPAGNQEDAAPRQRSQKEDEDENEEENEENQEGKRRFQVGHREAATYEAGDEEDAAIAAEARRSAEQRDLATEQAAQDEDEEEAAGLGSKSGAAASAAAGAAAGVGKGKAAEAGLATEERVDEGAQVLESTVILGLDAPKLLMLELVQRTAAATMIRSTEGIERCRVVAAQQAGGTPHCEAEGINFPGIWAHADLVDADAVTTNDVGSVMRTYGVEAGRATLLREVVKVFSVYGIGVDVRHLALIADFMTHQGGYRACNRMGIDSSTSPFLKISFETAAHFLTDATMRGATDQLTSPASRLVLGRVIEAGTGSMDLVQRLDTLML